MTSHIRNQPATCLIQFLKLPSAKNEKEKPRKAVNEIQSQFLHIEKRSYATISTNAPNLLLRLRVPNKIYVHMRCVYIILKLMGACAPPLFHVGLRMLSVRMCNEINRIKRNFQWSDPKEKKVPCELRHYL